MSCSNPRPPHYESDVQPTAHGDGERSMEKLRGEREGRETEMGRDKGRKGGERGSVERAIEGMGRGRMGGG